GQSEQSEGLRMYPNPNRGDQLYLSFDVVEEGVITMSVDIYDLFGKRVISRSIAVQGSSSRDGGNGFVNTVLDLNGTLTSGMYLVNITAGDVLYTERLVIQP
ncbi:MAG: T9SS type A sorting domain-containing protein, partial [Flavobacteriales bacterium]